MGQNDSHTKLVRTSESLKKDLKMLQDSKHQEVKSLMDGQVYSIQEVKELKGFVYNRIFVSAHSSGRLAIFSYSYSSSDCFTCMERRFPIPPIFIP